MRLAQRRLCPHTPRFVRDVVVRSNDMPKMALPAAMLLSLLICAIGAIAFIRAAQDHAQTSAGKRATQASQPMHSDTVKVQGKPKDVSHCRVECSAGG